METFGNWTPQPCRDILMGIGIMNATEEHSSWHSNVEIGSHLVLRGLFRTLIAGAITGASLAAGSRFKYGEALATTVGTVISIHSGMISMGGRALFQGTKGLVTAVKAKGALGIRESLATAVKAKDALGIRKSLSWMGGGLALLYWDRVVDRGDYYLAQMPADKLSSKIGAWWNPVRS